MPASSRESERLLSFETLPTDHVPAFEILPSILGDVFRWGLNRRMRGVIGEVEEERSVGVLRAFLAKEADRILGQRAGDVEISFRHFPRLPVQRERVVAQEVVRAAAHEAEMPVESSFERHTGAVPLADHHGSVAGRMQHLAEIWTVLSHGHIGTVRPPLMTGHQCRSARLAFPAIVKLRELQPAISQLSIFGVWISPP